MLIRLLVISRRENSTPLRSQFDEASRGRFAWNCFIVNFILIVRRRFVGKLLERQRVLILRGYKGRVTYLSILDSVCSFATCIFAPLISILSVSGGSLSRSSLTY